MSYFHMILSHLIDHQESIAPLQWEQSFSLFPKPQISLHPVECAKYCSQDHGLHFGPSQRLQSDLFNRPNPDSQLLEITMTDREKNMVLFRTIEHNVATQHNHIGHPIIWHKLNKTCFWVIKVFTPSKWNSTIVNTRYLGPYVCLF